MNYVTNSKCNIYTVGGLINYLKKFDKDMIIDSDIYGLMEIKEIIDTEDVDDTFLYICEAGNNIYDENR